MIKIGCQLLYLSVIHIIFFRLVSVPVYQLSPVIISMCSTLGMQVSSGELSTFQNSSPNNSAGCHWHLFVFFFSCPSTCTGCADRRWRLEAPLQEKPAQEQTQKWVRRHWGYCRRTVLRSGQLRPRNQTQTHEDELFARCWAQPQGKGSSGADGEGGGSLHFTNIRRWWRIVAVSCTTVIDRQFHQGEASRDGPFTWQASWHSLGSQPVRRNSVKPRWRHHRSPKTGPISATGDCEANEIYCRKASGAESFEFHWKPAAGRMWCCLTEGNRPWDQAVSSIPCIECQWHVVHGDKVEDKHSEKVLSSQWTVPEHWPHRDVLPNAASSGREDDRKEIKNCGCHYQVPRIRWCEWWPDKADKYIGERTVEFHNRRWRYDNNKVLCTVIVVEWVYFICRLRRSADRTVPLQARWVSDIRRGSVHVGVECQRCFSELLHQSQRCPPKAQHRHTIAAWWTSVLRPDDRWSSDVLPRRRTAAQWPGTAGESRLLVFSRGEPQPTSADRSCWSVWAEIEMGSARHLDWHRQRKYWTSSYGFGVLISNIGRHMLFEFVIIKFIANETLVI